AVRPIGQLAPLPLVDDRPSAVDVDERGDEDGVVGDGGVLQVVAHRLGEERQQAPDHPLLLAGQGAAGLVADGGHAGAELVGVVGAGLAADDAGEDVGDGQAVLLAGRALAAGLGGQEAGHAGRGGGEVVGLREEQETGGAEAGAGRLHGLVADRGVEPVAGQERVGHAGQHGLDRPAWRNQAAPWARMPGTLAMVSALLTSAGAAGVWPPGVAMTEPAPETGSAPTSSTPRREGGAMRGNGSRPATTSRRAVSSPNRYSDGPSTTRNGSSVHPAR